MTLIEFATKVIKQHQPQTWEEFAAHFEHIQNTIERLELSHVWIAHLEQRLQELQPILPLERHRQWLNKNVGVPHNVLLVEFCNKFDIPTSRLGREIAQRFGFVVENGLIKRNNS